MQYTVPIYDPGTWVIHVPTGTRCQVLKNECGAMLQVTYVYTETGEGKYDVSGNFKPVEDEEEQCTTLP